jgi:hypothetical protein
VAGLAEGGEAALRQPDGKNLGEAQVDCGAKGPLETGS